MGFSPAIHFNHLALINSCEIYAGFLKAVALHEHLNFSSAAGQPLWRSGQTTNLNASERSSSAPKASLLALYLGRYTNGTSLAQAD
jgi:hypothetical protein